MLRMSKSRGILAAVLVAVISMSWTDVQAGGASISDGPSGGDALRVVVLSNNSDGRDDTSQLATPEGFAQMRADQGTKVDMLVVDDAELEQLNPGRVEAFLNNGTILWVRGKKITPADVYASLSIAGSPGEISYGGFEQTGIYLYLLNGQVLCGLTGNALFVPSGMTEAEKARHADVVMDPVIDLQELAAGLRNDVGRITGNLACKIATETENDPIYTPLEAPSSSGIHDPANDIVTVNLNMVNLYNSIIGTAGVTQYRYLIYRFYRRSGPPECATYRYSTICDVISDVYATPNPDCSISALLIGAYYGQELAASQVYVGGGSGNASGATVSESIGASAGIGGDSDGAVGLEGSIQHTTSWSSNLVGVTRIAMLNNPLNEWSKWLITPANKINGATRSDMVGFRVRRDANRNPRVRSGPGGIEVRYAMFSYQNYQDIYVDSQL